MAIPDFQTLMLPVLKIVSLGPTKVSDTTERIADQFALTESERGHLLPSGNQTTISNRIAWSFSYLTKAGLLSRVQRATYEITTLGVQVLSGNQQRIDIKFLNQFEKFKEFRNTNLVRVEIEDKTLATNQNSVNDKTPEELIEEGTRELDSALQSELIDRLRVMPPASFETVIIDLMAAMGYGAKGAKTHVGKSGDGGIDGIISEDALGLDLIYLQAKRYAEGNNIGVEKIREFVGTLDERGATKGVFVTTSKFAAGALQFTSRSTKRVKLIDGEELTRLMIRHNVAVRTYRNFEAKKIDADYFDDLDT